MEKKSSIKKNFIYNSVYQLLLMITPLITSPYVSRTLGSEGLGVYSYTYAIANCFALVGMLGITNYGNRTIAALQDNKEKRSLAFWNILSLQAATTLIVLIVYIIYLLFGCPQEYKFVSVIQIMTVLCSLCDINWYFFGVEKFKITVTRNIIIKILNIILIFAFVRDSGDTALYSAIIVGSLLLSNLAVWPFLKKEVIFIKPQLKEVLSHLSQTIVLFIPVIAITLYKRMDKVMLGIFSTMNEVGFYENTEKIVNIPNSLIAALGTVMLPRMSYLFANNQKASADKYIAYSMEFVCFMASALMFGIAGISNEFAIWFFGEEFTDVGILIMAIAPTVLFVSWANVIRTQYLIPLHYDKIYVVSVWIGAVVNLIINALLIPKYGALGAVIGTDVAEGTVMLYQTFKVSRKLEISTYIKNGMFYFLAGFVMFIIIKLIGLKYGICTLTIILQILCGAFVYVLLCAPYSMRKHNITFSDICIRIRSKFKNAK